MTAMQHGNTALMLATDRYGSVDTVRWLLDDCDVDVDASTVRTRAPAVMLLLMLRRRCCVVAGIPHPAEASWSSGHPTSGECERVAVVVSSVQSCC